MRLPQFIVAGFTALALGPLGTGVSQASSFDAEYVFGDSLSDNGNLDELLTASHLYPSTGFPNPPSYHGSFTNGPTAVVDLAGSFGLPLNPSLWVTGFQDPAGLFGGASFVPGTNYAVASATAAAAAVGGPTGINLPQQLGAYDARVGTIADPNALYVVMIGGNDVRNAAIQGTGANAIQVGVQTEVSVVEALSSQGAKNILVVNVPSVGVIPEFTMSGQDGYGDASLATSLSQLYDSTLAADLNGLTGVNLFDLYGFNAAIAARAASYGFTNTTEPCYTNTPYSSATTAACGANAQNIGSFVYWDHIHPTAQVQALWAEGFAADLALETSAVPEASTWAMMLLGFCGLGFTYYRRTTSAGLAASTA